MKAMKYLITAGYTDLSVSTSFFITCSSKPILPPFTGKIVTTETTIQSLISELHPLIACMVSFECMLSDEEWSISVLSTMLPHLAMDASTAPLAEA